MGAPAQIKSHTGLRGVAALLVVGYHCQFGPGYRLPFERATELFTRGYLAVDLFFILSGFIIAHVNRADRSTPMSGREQRDFLLRRLIRIYPLLAFTLGVLVLFRLAAELIGMRSAMVAWGGNSLLNLAAQLLMLNAWLPHPSGWNTATWSISAELVAYLLFPALVTLHARSRGTAFLLLLAAPLIFYGAVARLSGSLDIPSGWAPLRCLAGFLLGMLIFHQRQRFAALGSASLGAIQIGAVAVALLLIALPSNDTLVILPFALIVATCWTDQGPLARLLARPLPLWLGERSYSIYLDHLVVHAILVAPWGYVARRLAPDPAIERILFLIVYLAAVLVAAHLTHRFVEVPARRLLTRRLLHREAPPITLSPAAP